MHNNKFHFDNNELNIIDFADVFTFILKDKKIIYKILVLSLLLLSCVLVFPLFFVVPYFVGYFINITKNVQKGKSELPEVEQWEKYFKTGLPLTLILVILTIVIFSFNSLMGAFKSLQFINISKPSDITNFGPQMPLSLPILLLIAVIPSFFQFIISNLYTVFYLCALNIQAKDSDYTKLLNFENYLEILKKNWVNLIIFVILNLIISYILFPIITVLTCCLGLIPFFIYIQIITAIFSGKLSE